ncbi:MAG: TonB-dependent receptor [Flavobacteriaceae bacterium]|nr:TonB-dependent receptor [Flavobacteriaceae bacterium]
MKTNLILFFILLFTNFIFGQTTATITGIVTDANNQPVEGANVKYNTFGTTTTKNGAYTLKIETTKSKRITLFFTHVSFNTYSKRVNIQKGKIVTFSPKLSIKTEDIEEVVIDAEKKKEEERRAASIEKIDKKEIENITTVGDEIKAVIVNKGLGVVSSNEESSTYNVRGGNYDENLVYINGIEVYRPFLVRSGQQEGLSFVNINLTKNVLFSSGGFQAKFGDKLASVLDITYRKPKDFSISLDASLLGASLTIEDRLFNNKLSAIIGARYANNSLIVNSKDIESNFRPSFTDIQSYLSYEISTKLSIDYLGNFALNKYDYQPVSRVTRFGTLATARALVVNYKGNEEDRYLTLFSALSANYKVNDQLKLNVTTSIYNTQEEEYFDIEAFYGIGEVNADFGGENFGEVEFTQSIGSQLDHARNDLDALINNVSVKVDYKITKDNIKDLFEFGAKYQHEDIKDRIREFEILDSAGFSIRPPDLIGNDEPYTPFTGPIVPFINIRATNNVKIDRLTAFAQWNRETYLNENTKIWFNLGARVHNWNVDDTLGNTKNQTVISPRATFAIKPENWEKDILFRFATGFYYQPPFYKELRANDGSVNVNVKAQKSIHFVLGSDYNFKLWERDFKLVTEAYYKNITDVNPFTIDNVQIRYAANNNAVAYAAGLDMRISGEFVPGTESYFTFGLLQTKENIDNRGYIFRPTDQRLKFAVLFQDYLPTNKNFKMFLNMIYNTGVPGGSPSGADPYQFQNRLKDYFRSDIGFNYILVDAKKKVKANWLKKFKELSVGLELFNMFDVQNSITNTWVRDVSSRRSFAIPNFLSGRILNTKISMKF